MELNKNIHLLKNCLSSCEKKLPCKFIDLDHVTSDIDDHIATIVNELKSTVFHISDEQELRNLHMYLLVNMDLDVAEELEDDHNVGTAVGSTSPLSPFLYLQIAVKVDLLKYVKELVETGPIALVLEILGIVDEEIEHLEIEEMCAVSGSVLAATLTRIKYVSCKFTELKLYDNAKTLLLYYRLDELRHKKGEEYYVEMGHKFLTLLKLFRLMLKLILNQVPRAETMELYKITLPCDPSEWYKDGSFKAKEEVIIDCVEMLYDKCKAYLHQISINFLFAWQDVTYAESTLRAAVAEESYYVCKLYENYKNLPQQFAPITEILNHFAAEKPATVTEELAKPKLTIHQVEKCITETDHLDASSLKEIKQFLDDCSQLEDWKFAVKLVRKLCSEGARNNATEIPQLKEIITSSLYKLKVEDLSAFLADFTAEYGIENILSEREIDLVPALRNANEFYSAAEEDNENAAEISLCHKENALKEVIIQSIRSVKYALFTLLEQCVSEKMQLKGVLEILSLLKPVCLYVCTDAFSAQYSTLLHAFKNILQNNFHKFSSSEKQSFVNLVVSLQNTDLINTDEFLAFCLLPMMYVKEGVSWEVMADLVKLFEKVYSSCAGTTTLSKSVILIQLAQVLEQTRWNVRTYTSHRVIVCEEVLTLMEIFLNSFSQGGCGEDIHWLNMQLKRFTYLTKSYFCNVCPITDTSSAETQFLSLIQKPSDVHTEFMKTYTNNQTALILPLSKVIVSLTSKELQNIVQNYSIGNHKRVFFVLNLLSDVVSFICNSASQLASVETEHSETIFNCLGHTVNCYLRLLEINITNCRSADEETIYIKCLNRMAATLKVFPDHILRTFHCNLIKVIQNILPKLKQTSIDFDGDTRQLLLGLCLL